MKFIIKVCGNWSSEGGRKGSLKGNLERDDTVRFTAVAQKEKNGVRWLAVDKSVKKTRQPKRYSGEGRISHLDDHGQYGYIQSKNGPSDLFQ